MYITELKPFSVSIFSKSEKEFFIFINMDYDIIWYFRKYKSNWTQYIVRTSCNFSNISSVKVYKGNDNYLLSNKWWSIFHFAQHEIDKLPSYEVSHIIEQRLLQLMTNDDIYFIQSETWDKDIKLKEKLEKEEHLYE